VRKREKNSEEDEAFEGVKVRMRDEKSERERRSLRVYDERGEICGGIHGESGKRENCISF